MGSYTKEMRRQMAEIEARIADGHKRGVCDSEGRSVKNGQGIFVARPMGFTSAAKTYRYDKYGNRTEV